jgi:hypothetical protein
MNVIQNIVYILLCRDTLKGEEAWTSEKLVSYRNPQDNMNIHRHENLNSQIVYVELLFQTLNKLENAQINVSSIGLVAGSTAHTAELGNEMFPVLYFSSISAHCNLI